MLDDPIVEEIRKIREAHAASFDYDLQKIYCSLKEEEIKSGYRFITLPPKRVKQEEQVHIVEPKK